VAAAVVLGSEPLPGKCTPSAVSIEERDELAEACAGPVHGSSSVGKLLRSSSSSSKSMLEVLPTVFAASALLIE
jgi:hypothetical protein